MVISTEHMQDMIFEYFDKIKALLSSEIWENMLLNCSKNELFVIVLIYRKGQVNMTEIADYINVPLNTATGIIARMEKKGIVNRMRSPEDKRVVTIQLTDDGKTYFKKIMTEMFHYGSILLECCNPEDLQRLIQIIDRFMDALVKEKEQKEQEKKSKIRKIIIE